MNCADKFTFLVKYEHFSVVSQNHQISSHFSDNALLNILLYLYFLHKLNLTWFVFPNFDWILLKSKESQASVKVLLLLLKHSCLRQHSIRIIRTQILQNSDPKASCLQFQLELAYHLNLLLTVKTP